MIAGRRVGLACLTVGEAAPVDHIEAAAAAGFDEVGLRVVAPGDLSLAHDIAGSPALQQAIRAACARTGVRVFDVDVLTLAPATDAAAFAAALDAAAAIGATLVQVVVEDPDRTRAADRFAALCDAAAARGLRVAVEFMRWRAVRTLADADALVLASGRANAGLCIDCLHLARSGGSAAALAAIAPARIDYVQLCDAPAAAPPDDRLRDEARGGRLHPGEGALPLRAMLDALPPHVPLSAEVPRRSDDRLTTRERAQQAARALERFLGAAAPGIHNHRRSPS